MDPRKLIRDHSKVCAGLRQLPNKTLVATKGIKIYIPERYTTRGLATVGIETHILGIHACVVDDLFYTTKLVNAMMHVTPTSTLTVLVEEEPYYEFYFEPGSVIIPNTMLFKDDTLVFRIYDEILSKGRIPWYLDYNLDLGRLYETAKKHADANVGQMNEVIEILFSMIARDPNDRTVYYRHRIQSLDDTRKISPAFIPLRSVQYAAGTTLTKFVGSYFGESTISALQTDTKEVEKIEQILRK